MWVLRALGLSRVTMIGGLDLFLEPGGRPRGRRVVVGVPPELVVATVSGGESLESAERSSSELGLCREMEGGGGPCCRR